MFLIAYGSLYPFEFDFKLPSSELITKLLNFNVFQSSLSDMLANILLFLPYGYLMGYLWKQKEQTITTALFLCVSTFLFAFLIQVFQLWTPERIPSGSDAILNVLGGTIGALLFLLLFKNSKNLNQLVSADKWFMLFLLLFFLLFHLRPFVPTFDWGFIKNNIKGLFIYSSFDWFKSIEKIIFWLIPFFLIKRMGIVVNVKHLVILCFSILVLQLLIVDSTVDVNNIISATIALIIWKWFDGVLSTRNLLLVLLGTYIISAFSPFELTAQYKEFSWLPFAGSLNGSMLINVSALIEKILVYITILWLSIELQKNLKKSIFWLVLTVFLVEYLQVFFVATTPDITDTILVILAGVILKSAEHHKLLVVPTLGQKISYQQIILPEFSLKFIPFKQYSTILVSLLLMTVAQSIIFAFPNLPYNLRELFINGGSFLDHFFLSLSALFFVTGLVWVSRKVLEADISLFKAPLYCALVSIITLFLLKLSVTNESIADINGSSNIVWQLTGDKILGEFGASFILFVGVENARIVSRVFEPFIRFAALTGPITYFSVISLLFLANTKVSNKFKFLMKIVLAFFPYFFLCKLISFDFSSTDNLNELIERDGAYGFGGGGYLYVLFFLIIVNGVWLASSLYRKKIIQSLMLVIFVGLSIPIGWYLLNAGLVSEFTKYGYTYSGVDFFLGPNRGTLISEQALLSRWAIVQTTSIAVITFGIYLGMKAVHFKGLDIDDDNHKPTSSPQRNTIFQLPHLRKFLYVSVGIAIVIFLLYFLGENNSKSITTVNWSHKEANILMDHHTHSKFSDGKLSVEALVALSSLNGCNAIAITDHSDSKRAMTNGKLEQIATARIKHPDMLIFGGVELEMPSYQRREHVSLLFPPTIENEMTNKLNQLVFNKGVTDEQLLTSISSFTEQTYQVLGIYNHPSRKDLRIKENIRDVLKWNQKSKLIIGLAGAPGHQKSQNIGSYNEKFSTIDRWDPAVAQIAGDWDILLSYGHQIWGAIASSDFHNSVMDEPPCGFARNHLITNEPSYKGVLLALQAGTFWADHGKILKTFKFYAEVDKVKGVAFPGDIVNSVENGDFASIHFELQRDIGSLGLPLQVEVISSCKSGTAELITTKQLTAYQNTFSTLLPLLKVGKDEKSCYVRARVRLETKTEHDLMAYSNHIRFNF